MEENHYSIYLLFLGSFAKWASLHLKQWAMGHRIASYVETRWDIMVFHCAHRCQSLVPSFLIFSGHIGRGRHLSSFSLSHLLEYHGMSAITIDYCKSGPFRWHLLCFWQLNVSTWPLLSQNCIISFDPKEPNTIGIYPTINLDLQRTTNSELLNDASALPTIVTVIIK